MEMNILIKAEERLLNVLERLAKAWETSLHTQEPTTTTANAGNITAATITTEMPKMPKMPKMPETPETPKTTKHLHYGLQADGVSTYTKWITVSMEVSNLQSGIKSLKNVTLPRQRLSKHQSQKLRQSRNRWRISRRRSCAQPVRWQKMRASMCRTILRVSQESNELLRYPRD